MSIDSPTRYTLLAGGGEGKTPLNSFDAALLNAGAGNINLIKISSILPPAVVYTDKLAASYGAFVYTAYTHITSVTPDEIIASSVCVGIPEDPNLPGVIMEYSHKGTKEISERIVTNMVKEAFRMREWPLKEIKIASFEMKTMPNKIATTFAGVFIF